MKGGGAGAVESGGGGQTVQVPVPCLSHVTPYSVLGLQEVEMLLVVLYCRGEFFVGIMILDSMLRISGTERQE